MYDSQYYYIFIKKSRNNLCYLAYDKLEQINRRKEPHKDYRKNMKIMTLNIEASKHLDKFPQAIREEKPDVLCLQEVCEHDLEKIAGLCEFEKYEFRPKLFLSKEHQLVDRDSSWGIAIFSHKKLSNVREVIYREADPVLSRENYATIDSSDDRQKAQRGVVLIGELGGYTIGTLHFTWSPVVSTPLQRENADLLMRSLADTKNLILCGDFNVPRIQNDCYEVFTQRFVDVVPEKYTMSVDRDLHIRGEFIDEDLMVDYIFCDDIYQAMDVRLIDGVSDHMAVVGEIKKVSS